MNHFVLGKYRFNNEEEYIEAKKELQLIEKIRKDFDFTSFNEVDRLYHKISSGEIILRTQIGRDFDDEIYDIHKKLKETDSLDIKINNKKRAKGSDIKIEDFDEKMQSQILLEMKRREKRRMFLLISCGLIVLGCVLYIGYYYFMTSQNRRDIEQLSQRREQHKNSLSTLPTESDVQDDSPYYATISSEEYEYDILPLYKDLYNQNKSLIGWLKIADTIIDYPVMQSEDNEYFLDRNFNHQYDKNGSIFLDAQCSIMPRSDNLILYGHHMKSGNMFGNLWRYEDENYYFKHKYIEFDTLYEAGIYEVMYVFRDKVYSQEEVTFKYYEFIDANSKEEFESNMNEMALRSYYDTGVRAEYGDKLLTLSTCDYAQNNGRFVVVARQISNH